MSQDYKSTTRHPGAGPDLQTIKTLMEKGFAGYGRDPRTTRPLQRLATEYPDLFFTEAARYLESDAATPTGQALAGLLIRQESFFERLTNPSERSLENAIGLFRCLLRLDPTLDFKLARMLSGRNDVMPDNVLTKGHAARAIDILEQTSRGPQLFSVLGHLTHSADEQISAKAALFVGRRIDNPDWTAKQLLSENDRLRANALEAFWGSTSHASLRIISDCVGDENNRVAGNALVALHAGGHPGAEEEAIAMSLAEDPRRRATAAWAMSKIAKPAFTNRLLELVRDENADVRIMATQALAAIEKAEKPGTAVSPVPGVEIKDVEVEVETPRASGESPEETSMPA